MFRSTPIETELVIVEERGPLPEGDPLAALLAGTASGPRDERLLVLRQRLGGRLVGRFVPYAAWAAQRRDPTPGPLLLQPLAVSGLLRTPEGVLFGKRSLEVTQHPGDWELVPSGGLSPSARLEGGRVSPQAQLRTESAEELGLELPERWTVTPFALVEDLMSGVFDVACEVALDLPLAEIEARFAERPTREYSELRHVPLADLEPFLATEADRVAPISRELLSLRGLLGPQGRAPA